MTETKKDRIMLFHVLNEIIQPEARRRGMSDAEAAALTLATMEKLKDEIDFKKECEKIKAGEALRA